MRGRRCLFPCISGFTFALFRLFGELSSEEVAACGVDSPGGGDASLCDGGGALAGLNGCG